MSRPDLSSNLQHQAIRLLVTEGVEQRLCLLQTEVIHGRIGLMW